MKYMFDLTTPEDAYLYGLLQTDGNHYGSLDSKGKVTIELAVRDIEILRRLQAHLSCYASVTTRIRETNFSVGEYETATLGFFQQSARQALADLGLPPGPKSRRAAPPGGQISTRDYVRGLFDGDGSVGFTSRGYPFVSFVSASESLTRYVEAVMLDVSGAVRHTNPNARDGVYNVMVCNGPAVSVAEWLYYAGALALERKAAEAQTVLEWSPPSARFGVPRKKWTPEQDVVVLANNDTSAAELLDRTVRSVNLRRWRLTTAGS